MTKHYTYRKPAGFYPETRADRYRCDVAGCDHFATWRQISGPDKEQDLRWLCLMHKDLVEEAAAQAEGGAR